MIGPRLLEEALRIENLVVFAAIVVALDIAIPQETPMEVKIPTSKAEARALLTKLLDDLDGTHDETFDAKAFGRRAAAAFADDWKENVIIVVVSIAAWEVMQAVWRLI